MTNDLLKHEAKGHGTLLFPYVIYHTLIPAYITNYPLHWHDEIEFIIVKFGEVIFEMEYKEYHLHEGDVLVILPQKPHAIKQVDDKQCEFFNILFSFSLLESDRESLIYQKYLMPFAKREKTLPAYEEYKDEITKTLTPYLNDLLEDRFESYSTEELRIKADCFMLMHELSKYSVKTGKNDVAMGQTYTKIKPAIYYVQNAYSTNITVNTVAKLCNLSESHFMKLFKELTGMSFTAHLVDYRLQMAANQLKNKTLKIIDIAETCGFNNHSYFSRAFIKKYGMTPNDYRKKL